MTVRSLAWSTRLTIIYALILAAVSGGNLVGADRWWLGALNLYLPQWLWALPGLLLFFWALLTKRGLAWFPIVCVLWALGPMMGLHVHLRGEARNRANGGTLRVLSCNVKYGSRDIRSLVADIRVEKPDVVLLQDAGGVMRGPLGEALQSWNVREFGQYVTASRFPLPAAEIRWISFLRERHTFWRCVLELEGRSLAVYNVHLQTPRWGLNALRRARHRPWSLPDAFRDLQANADIRLEQARLLASSVGQETLPVILGGDLNSPPGSAVLKTLKVAGLKDAFAEAGLGYGYTYGQFLLRRRLSEFRIPWLRLDYIMTGGALRAERCWTGSPEASDHLPVIADIAIAAVL